MELATFPSQSLSAGPAVQHCSASTLVELEALAAHPRCVAIGECGLDFNRNFSEPAVQERWFGEQVGGSRGEAREGLSAGVRAHFRLRGCATPLPLSEALKLGI